ncbi:hypothetical protein Mapa_013366 [Marchantia paleacea]|nr:hypothetical protein Mapa_013366 [Marchantia paleacea]
MGIIQPHLCDQLLSRVDRSEKTTLNALHPGGIAMAANSNHSTYGKSKSARSLQNGLLEPRLRSSLRVCVQIGNSGCMRPVIC